MVIDEIWIRLESTVAKGSEDVLTEAIKSIFQEVMELDYLVYLVKQVEKLCCLHL